jgi:AcrR family transcriptional regulator
VKNVRGADILSVATIRIILVAARVLLLANGCQRTTLGDVAQAAQMTLSTVTRYFDSKEHLYAAVLREDLEALLCAVQTSYQPTDNALDNLLAAHDAAGRFVADYRHMEGFRLLADAILSHGALDGPGEAGSPSSIFRRGGAEKAAQIVGHFQTILEEGIGRGHFRPMDAHQGARLQLGMCFGCARPLPFPLHETRWLMEDEEMRRTFHELIAGGVLERHRQ